MHSQHCFLCPPSLELEKLSRLSSLLSLYLDRHKSGQLHVGERVLEQSLLGKVLHFIHVYILTHE